MTDKSDHLIERAAALLRSASATRAPEQARGGALHGETVSDLRPIGAPLPRSDAGPRLPPGVPPLLVPPPRAGAIGPGSGMLRPRAAQASGTVADLRAGSTHQPITLEVLERAGLMVARNKRTRTAEE